MIITKVCWILINSEKNFAPACLCEEIQIAMAVWALVAMLGIDSFLNKPSRFNTQKRYMFTQILGLKNSISCKSWKLEPAILLVVVTQDSEYQQPFWVQNHSSSSLNEALVYLYYLLEVWNLILNSLGNRLTLKQFFKPWNDCYTSSGLVTDHRTTKIFYDKHQMLHSIVKKKKKKKKKKKNIF